MAKGVEFRESISGEDCDPTVLTGMTAASGLSPAQLTDFLLLSFGALFRNRDHDTLLGEWEQARGQSNSGLSAAEEAQAFYHDLQRQPLNVATCLLSPDIAVYVGSILAEHLNGPQDGVPEPQACKSRKRRRFVRVLRVGVGGSGPSYCWKAR